MIRRYDVSLHGPIENDAGAWVRYDDHAAEVERLSTEGLHHVALTLAARNALPDLLAELHTLRARVAELERAARESDDALHEYHEATAERLAQMERDLQRDQPRAALAAILRELDALMRESEGVAGLHLNGDVATWEELETTWLSIDAVREWAAKFERDAQLGATVREAVERMESDHVAGHYRWDGSDEIIIDEGQLDVLRAIADALRAEEGGEHG